jgi:hypothetical protein
MTPRGSLTRWLSEKKCKNTMRRFLSPRQKLKNHQFLYIQKCWRRRTWKFATLTPLRQIQKTKNARNEKEPAASIYENAKNVQPYFFNAKSAIPQIKTAVLIAFGK